MIWLIGCKGMLGSEVAKQLEEKKLPWVGTDKEVDITDPQALLDFTNKIETGAQTKYWICVLQLFPSKKFI